MTYVRGYLTVSLNDKETALKRAETFKLGGLDVRFFKQFQRKHKFFAGEESNDKTYFKSHFSIFLNGRTDLKSEDFIEIFYGTTKPEYFPSLTYDISTTTSPDNDLISNLKIGKGPLLYVAERFYPQEHLRKSLNELTDEEILQLHIEQKQYLNIARQIINHSNIGFRSVENNGFATEFIFPQGHVDNNKIEEVLNKFSQEQRMYGESTYLWLE
jgi:hypothetical protein